MNSFLYNYGSINIDHVYQVPHLVRPGETLTSSSYRQVLGGKGANQSLAMARAGGKLGHWGRLSAQDRWALEPLVEAGVDVEGVELCDESSGHALIQVDAAAENAIILYPGANHGFSDRRIDTLIAQAQPGDGLLLQNECNGLARVMLRAREAGMVIAFNPAPMTADVIQLPLADCQCLFVNRVEAADLAGLPADSDAQQLLDALSRQLPDGELVLTLGSEGVCYQGGGKRLSLPSHRVTAVDTTAAGDTFIGYFLAARQAGESAEHCLRLASAASALCVQRPGAAPSIPTIDEVKSAMDSWAPLQSTPLA
ncbi:MULTISPECIES: ribokinase [Halomonadaceae]|uniref:ribokinase n=1 Tax=Halomonadaceae TaxID=28256 RepID=UPI00200C9B07|nr:MULTISPECIES: ribokinase [unclassified Halomonas]